MYCSIFLSLLLALLFCSSFSSAFVMPRQASNARAASVLYSDGANPPPFANWGQPTAPPALPPPAAAAAASVAPPPAQTPAVSMTCNDAIAVLHASQTQIVDKIAASIPDLAVKPDFCWNGDEETKIAGVQATLDARDAPGPANIAWLASIHIPNKLSSLTIFNGPLTNVPHLLSRVAVDDSPTSRLELALDFRPRAYGAYELINPQDGTYPGPETLGRQAFEYSGNRKDYETHFVNNEVQAFLKTIVDSLDGAVLVNDVVATATLPQEELLTRGPHCLHVSMPLNDANIAAVEKARTQAANYWLSWVLDQSHSHRPGAPVNTQYVYDTKFKINAYGALLPVYTKLFGQADGAKLTAAESGPLDEAYVGGGS
mmetsp:Transcript_18309/g.33182  ORF Transcript_18309/g.33182 Transcript_18309/m.33182 type:complete len:372 (-) Transcript_18309:79-1194(-)